MKNSCLLSTRQYTLFSKGRVRLVLVIGPLRIILDRRLTCNEACLKGGPGVSPGYNAGTRENAAPVQGKRDCRLASRWLFGRFGELCCIINHNCNYGCNNSYSSSKGQTREYTRFTRITNFTLQFMPFHLSEGSRNWAQMHSSWPGFFLQKPAMAFCKLQFTCTKIQQERNIAINSR